MSKINTKICSTCKIEKDLSEFNKCSRLKDGLSIYCKSCYKEMKRKQYLKYKEKYAERAKKPEVKKLIWASRIKRTYGISADEYYELLKNKITNVKYVK